MATKVQSIRPWLRWVTAFTACLFPFTQKEVRNYVGQKMALSPPPREKVEKGMFTKDILGQMNDNLELACCASYSILTAGSFYVSDDERDFARNNLNHDLTPEFIKQKSWNYRNNINEVATIDICLARNNPDTAFSEAIAEREDFPIEKRDLFKMRDKPYTRFSDGLRKNSKLGKAIRKFNLSKDPYFKVYLEDEKQEVINDYAPWLQL